MLQTNQEQPYMSQQYHGLFLCGLLPGGSSTVHGNIGLFNL